MPDIKGGAIVRYDNHPVEDDQTRLDILDALLAGKTVEEVAAELNYHRVEIQKVAGFLGWPTVAYAQRSRDALAARIAGDVPAVVAPPVPAEPKPIYARPKQAPRPSRVARAEARRGTDDGRARQAESSRKAMQQQTERLDRLGVNLVQVKAWGASNGHEVKAGGRIRITLLNAYEEAHQ